MSTDTIQDPVVSRLYSHLNEEKLARDIASVQLQKIKTLDELIQEIQGSDKKADLIRSLEDNLKENPDSLVSRYILGRLQFVGGDDAGVEHLRSLLEDFRNSARWPIVDHIADAILAADDSNRVALRAKIESTERLRGKKELKPYLEKLAAVDKRDPDVARKYAQAIIEEDPARALIFLKQAGEAYARIKDYKNLEDVWNQIVQHDPGDISFFESVERTLVGHREKTRIAAYYANLVEHYKKVEDWNTTIVLLKKVLEYEPNSRARSDLVRAYRTKYESHSLLNEFLKMSDLTNHKKAVGPCIASFERNIVFDKDNFVHHRTRGVGKITEIDKDQVIIDFKDHPGQKMSIQMAITSLQPLNPEHIWVRTYANQTEIQEIFEQDVPMFFDMLLTSFQNKISLAELKIEVTRFLKGDDWSKWWTRARTEIKKHPRFAFNPKNKNELLLREREIKREEELSLKFNSTNDLNAKMEIALEVLKDEAASGAVQTCTQYYLEQENSKDKLKRLHAYFYLDLAEKSSGDNLGRKIKKQEIIDQIKAETAKGLLKIATDTPFVEFKRELASLIIKVRPDYTEIVGELIFDVPSNLRSFIINELNRLGQKDALVKFVDRVFKRSREYPEIFLWIARAILSGQWTYDWIPVSREDVLLHVFRILKPLVNLEKKGTKLKNQALEAIFGTTNITVESLRKSELPAFLKDADISNVRKMAVLFKEIPYAPDAQKENFMEFLASVRPDFSMAEPETVEEESADMGSTDLMPADNVILVTNDGLAQRKKHLDHLINVEMPANSRDIGEAQERGDLRENAEYKAAMERQTQLRAEITRVDEEIKRAQVMDPSRIRTDVVTIGTAVTVEDSDGQTIVYSLLGPWEADADRNVISYLSPLGRALIGKKPGESARLEAGSQFKIQKISKISI
ncbi:MAG: transcription elongation factor GreA [Leptospirales bacterium]|nr:transcription elongation factor GreA [Leptospirales bacterium]